MLSRCYVLTTFLKIPPVARDQCTVDVACTDAKRQVDNTLGFLIQETYRLVVAGLKVTRFFFPSPTICIAIFLDLHITEHPHPSRVSSVLYHSARDGIVLIFCRRNWVTIQRPRCSTRCHAQLATLPIILIARRLRTLRYANMPGHAIRQCGIDSLDATQYLWVSTGARPDFHCRWMQLESTQFS